MHLLHLIYHEAEKKDMHRSFQVALDSSDLQQLKSAIDRAESKQKALETTLKAAGIPRLGE